MRFVLESFLCRYQKKKFQKLIHALFVVAQLLKTASDDMGRSWRNHLNNEHILKEYIVYIQEAVYSILS